MTFARLLVVSFVVAVAAVLLYGSCVNEFQTFSLPSPVLEGRLSAKGREIRGAEKLFEFQLFGPESVEVDGDFLYTCTFNGDCMKASLKDGTILKSIRLTEHNSTHCLTAGLHALNHCGRPNGLRRKSNGSSVFFVADAVLGLFELDFEKETHRQLLSSSHVVDGRPLTFLEDLEVVGDSLVVSQASTKHSYLQFLCPLLDHGGNGRVLQMGLSDGEIKVLMEGLNYPAGVQRHPDGKSVLVVESAMARIHRFYLTGPKQGKRELFAENLPAFPDNIRLSADNRSFYVGMFGYRGDPSTQHWLYLERWSEWPLARWTICEISKHLPDSQLIQLSANTVGKHRYGIVVKLDMEGRVINSYHDTTGAFLNDVSHVVDDGGKYLYMGSFSQPYVGRMLKHGK